MKRGSYNRPLRKIGKTRGKQDQLVRKKDPFFGLQDLANRFNRLRAPETLAPQEREPWVLAERIADCVVADSTPEPDEYTTILTRRSPSLESAINLFNFDARNVPVRLSLSLPRKGDKREVLPIISPQLDSTAPDTAWSAILLWWFFFHEKGWKRMHRCRVCKKWIVARARNMVMRYCPTCSPDKYWTWKQRITSPNYGKRKNPRKGVQR
jgi:hypothetical protein